MQSPRTPSWIQRLRAEIRSACGTVETSKPSSPSHAPSHHPQAARPIGEWLGSVRQSSGGFVSPIRSARRSSLGDSAADHPGDLMRTRVTRIKGARACLRY